MLPDGRKVHIVLSPEEAESLRQRLTAIQIDEPFDLVISGSPEHLDALRQAHSHHETRREALKARLGDDYDEFENVRAELDALGGELHMLTDHAVALDANFSKYGYSAHLRTYDEHSPAGGSSASSISGFHDPDHDQKDWEAERRNGRVMKIYKKVTVPPKYRKQAHKLKYWSFAECAVFFQELTKCNSLRSDSIFTKACYGERVKPPKWPRSNYSWICYMLEYSPSMAIMPLKIQLGMSS